MQRRMVEQRREADFETYHRWEYERREYDEITDVAERVRAPISPVQEFTLTAEGLVSARGEPLRPVVQGGVTQAERMAISNPDWQVEAERGQIDLEELAALEGLAIRGEGVMVSYWLIPDTVRDGTSKLPGYNRERLKMFTRVAAGTSTGVIVKYSSYDGSYIPGVQAMDEALGFQFNPNRGSEQIARERRHLTLSGVSVDDIDNVLRRAYDGALTRDFGGEWYGGRPPLAIKDVVGFISEQKSLLGEHMGELAKIFALTTNPHERNKLMEKHRYNLAAAIDDLIHGKQVVSAAEAGDAARDEGRNLDGDCPTGEDASAVDQLNSIGFKTKNDRIRILMNAECRTCLTKKVVVTNECHMCLDCEWVHETQGNAGLDRVMREAKERQAKLRRRGKAMFAALRSKQNSKKDYALAG